MLFFLLSLWLALTWNMLLICMFLSCSYSQLRTTYSHLPSTGTRTVVLLHQTTIPQLHQKGDHINQLKDKECRILITLLLILCPLIMPYLCFLIQNTIDTKHWKKLILVLSWHYVTLNHTKLQKCQESYNLEDLFPLLSWHGKDCKDTGVPDWIAPLKSIIRFECKVILSSL